MKQDMIIKLVLTRKKLLSIVNKLPDERILVDKWTKKEILAHIAGWEEEGIDLIHGNELEKLFSSRFQTGGVFSG